MKVAEGLMTGCLVDVALAVFRRLAPCPQHLTDLMHCSVVYECECVCTLSATAALRD